MNSRAVIRAGLAAAVIGVVSIALIPFQSAGAAGPSYVQTGFIHAPGRASQLIFSSTYNTLILRVSGSAIRVLDLADGATTTFLAASLFTDMSLSPDGRYVYVADYGYENIGYGTPRTPSHVGRLDLQTGTWMSKATSAIAYHVEATGDDRFILTSHDQWITFSYNDWGSGPSTTMLNSFGNDSPGYYAIVYFGDIEYDSITGRLIHGNSDSSSRQISAFRLAGDEFVSQEGSGFYGSANAHGGTSVLATDSRAFYYGNLQTDSLDVGHNIRVFPESIWSANATTAFGDGKYYDAATGQIAGSLGFSTTVYGLNEHGDDFWVYDLVTETLRHFAPTDGVTPPGRKANADTASAAFQTTIAIDALANDTGFDDPVTVTITTPPSHGTATVSGVPGPQASVRIDYRATDGYAGPDALVYQVNDGTHTDSAGIGITVAPVKANNDTFTVLANTCCNKLEVGLNDIGFADPVTIRATSSPTRGGHASISAVSGSRATVYIDYSANLSGNPSEYTESFTYTISDGAHQDTATASVKVTTVEDMSPQLLDVRMLYPLHAGARWDYQSSDGTRRTSRVLSRQRTINQLRAWVVRDSGSDEFYQASSSIVRDLGFDALRGPQNLLFQRGLILARRADEIGKRYVGTGSIAGRDSDGERGRGAYQFTRKIVGYETVSVPAGTFEALRVDYSLLVHGGNLRRRRVSYTNWLVAGIGMVRFRICSVSDRITR